MRLTSKTCLFACFTALLSTAHPAFAAGRVMGGGNVSHQAFNRQPAIVNRSLPGRNQGNVRSLNPSGGLKNGNYSGVVRNNQLGIVKQPSASPNSNHVTAQCHHDDSENHNRVPADPNRVPVDPNRVPANPNRIPRQQQPGNTLPRNPVAPPPHESHTLPKPERPEVPEILQSVGPGHAIDLNPTVPRESNKPIKTQPGERPIRSPLPARGVPAAGGASDFRSQLSSLLSGLGGSGSGDSGAAVGAEEAAPLDAPSPAPPPASNPVATSPAQAVEARTNDVLDVELTDVRLVEEGSLERKVGPRYRLYYRNVGNVEAPKFHVSVVVDLDEKLTDKAELITVEAVGLQPGKSQTVDVHLPVEVLNMAIDDEGRPTASNAFVALIDSDDDLAETNEKNNILVFSRDKIELVKK